MLTFTYLLPLSVTTAKSAIVHAILDPALNWGQTFDQTSLYQFGSGSTAYLSTLKGVGLSRDSGTGAFLSGDVQSIDLIDVSVSYDFTAAVSGLSISGVELQGQLESATAAGDPYAALERSLFDRFRQNWSGSKGDDTMEGGLKSDVLRGHGGDDLFIATRGDDRLIGGTGYDSVAFEDLGKFGSMNVDNGAGIAELRSGGSTLFTTTLQSVECIALTNLADTAQGGFGDDCIYGLAGDDVIEDLYGNNQFFGEAGDDALYGGTQNDVLDGGARNDLLVGDISSGGPTGVAYGEDQLFGRGGRDQLKGEGNNDVLDGGNGRDKLDGGEDDDQLTGGDGDDRFWFGFYDFSTVGTRHAFGYDTIVDFTAGDVAYVSRDLSAQRAFIATSQVASDTLLQFKQGATGPVVESITLQNVNVADLVLQTDTLEYTFWLS